MNNPFTKGSFLWNRVENKRKVEEPFVNAVITIVVPLDDVSVDDPPNVKLQAADKVADLFELNEDVAMIVEWEDVDDRNVINYGGSE